MRDVEINECMNHSFEFDRFIFYLLSFWNLSSSILLLSTTEVRTWVWNDKGWVSADKIFIFGWIISLSNTTGMMSMIPGEMGKKIAVVKKKKKKKAEMETSQVCMSPERDISHCFMYPDGGTWQSYFPYFSPNNPFLHSLKHLLSSIILLSLFTFFHEINERKILWSIPLSVWSIPEDLFSIWVIKASDCPNGSRINKALGWWMFLSLFSYFSAVMLC